MKLHCPYSHVKGLNDLKTILTRSCLANFFIKKYIEIYILQTQKTKKIPIDYIIRIIKRKLSKHVGSPT